MIPAILIGSMLVASAQTRLAIATPTWTGSVRCEIDIKGPGYANHQTHTWTLTGALAPDGNPLDYPATWSVSGAGSLQPTSTQTATAATWKIQGAAPGVRMAFFVRRSDQQLLVFLRNAQLTVADGTTFVRQPTVTALRNQTSSAPVLEWRPFPTIVDAPTSTRITGSSTTPITNRLDATQPLGSQGQAVCTWDLAQSAGGAVSGAASGAAAAASAGGAGAGAGVTSPAGAIAGAGVKPGVNVDGGAAPPASGAAPSSGVAATATRTAGAAPADGAAGVAPAGGAAGAAPAGAAAGAALARAAAASAPVGSAAKVASAGDAASGGAGAGAAPTGAAATSGGAAAGAAGSTARGAAGAGPVGASSPALATSTPAPANVPNTCVDAGARTVNVSPGQSNTLTGAIATDGAADWVVVRFPSGTSVRLTVSNPASAADASNVQVEVYSSCSSLLVMTTGTGAKTLDFADSGPHEVFVRIGANPWNAAYPMYTLRLEGR